VVVLPREFLRFPEVSNSIVLDRFTAWNFAKPRNIATF
jgi:hypothetical protein